VQPGDVDYSQVLSLDLSTIEPNVAGPKRPQDRIPLSNLKSKFQTLVTAPVADGGYGKTQVENRKSKVESNGAQDGDVVIAAITSCTNTSNPSVMIGAGLLAKKAVERGLKAKPWVKASLAPGSRVVSEYLDASGLQASLDRLGFMLAGYSCTTCFGGSGPIDAGLEKSINDNDAVACAVLSGNRNFEARIHPAVRAAFLMSPPLVVAFAIAGRVDIDMATEPLGTGSDGRPVYLKEIWPSQDELAAVLRTAASAEQYRKVYGMDHAVANPYWEGVARVTGEKYAWSADSTYIKEPPFLEPEWTGTGLREFKGARALAILGNSITTDHISPIGSIKASTPAGLYLQGLGVKPADFNNYGSRRMNHEVMVRGTFANVRLRNMMTPGVEGGVTVHQPDGRQTTIYEAAMQYAKEKVPLFVIAGEEYGTGSARDWAAKGTRLLGVRAIIAGSFERIHRSNLVGMGVLPCQLPAGVTATTLRLKGDEEFDLLGLDGNARPRQDVTLVIRRKDGTQHDVPLVLRLDTAAEIDYVRCGGIMPYILAQLAA
jgi:aconitate hydratase